MKFIFCVSATMVNVILFRIIITINCLNWIKIVTAIFEGKMFMTQPAQGTAIRISLHSTMFWLANITWIHYLYRILKTHENLSGGFVQKNDISCLGH
jgi:hypothetical protein